MRKGSVAVCLPVLMLALCAGAAAVLAQPGAASATQAAQGESQKPFDFKSSSHLVVVDVVATNGKGEPVTDLKAGDLILTEDGHPQTLSSFSFQSGGPAAATETSTGLPPLAPGVVSNVPRRRNAGSWNVIVLDSLNSPLLDQSNTRQQLLQVVEKLPDQPVAIYVLGADLRILQDFSSDPRVLKQVIAGLKNKSSALLDNPKGGHEAERYPAPFFQSLPVEIQNSILRWEGEGTGARTLNRLQLTLAALNAIARNLKPLPGRKNLIWISEGFPFSIDPGNVVTAHDKVSGTDYRLAVSSTANALFDSQVAIYPIDSRGILTSAFYDSASHGVDAMGRKETQIGPNSTTSLENAEWDSAHASMQEIAERTGGRAFYNRNEIGNAILESLNDGATYYTLAYSPTNHDWNGRFRHIHVKAGRPGLKLRYRLGYFAVPSTAGSAGEQTAAFNRAMDANAPASTGILFEAKVLPMVSGNQIVVNYAIMASGLTFQTGPDQLQHMSVNCAVEAYSAKGESVNKDGASYTAALRPEVYDRVVREGFPCQQRLTLPPGEYVLRLGVRDNTTGQIGATQTTITVASSPQPVKGRK